MRQTVFGTRYYLKGCRLHGASGAPAVPLKTVRIALPHGTKAKELNVNIIGSRFVSQSPTLVSCIQAQVDPFLRNQAADIAQLPVITYKLIRKF